LSFVSPFSLHNEGPHYLNVIPKIADIHTLKRKVIDHHSSKQIK